MSSSSRSTDVAAAISALRRRRLMRLSVLKGRASSVGCSTAVASALDAAAVDVAVAPDIGSAARLLGSVSAG